MLLDGVNHVAILTNDTDRLQAFYREMFDAVIGQDGPAGPGSRLSFVHIGHSTELNVFEVPGNTEAQRQTPMFGRGRLDHLGLQAASLEAFNTIRSRLIERGASDGFVTDFGPILSVFFRDPDGLEGEVCVANPDAVSGVVLPPGTPPPATDPMWDPAVYQQYGDERTRPFVDLLARVRADDPQLVVDLGCGPGDQTATLLQRWPATTVVGVDSSPEMIDAAQAHAVAGRLTFVQADAREWLPDRPVDVLVSNATLQWIPDHLDLLAVLARSLAPDGWLAFQVPGNFDAPSHVELTVLRESPRWRDRLAADAARGAGVHEPATYLNALVKLGLTADVWETTYLHVLGGDDAVLEWTKGTALRPVFAVLAGAERDEFVADYAARLRAAYPRGEFGTVFPFRRIFAVARRGPGGNLR